MKATLTVDRGDRPRFMDFCKVQLSRMGNGATNIIIDYPPHSNQFDLVARFKKGILQAIELGIDKIIVVESDDAYPADYYKYFDFDKYDFIGWGNSFYYNIKLRTWQRTHHGGPDGHSSLCATGFRLSALAGFVWPPDDNIWLDIALWKFARQRGLKWKLFETDCPVIGIKHGVGRYGGKGHTLQMKNRDDDFSFLRSRVDEESLNFYIEMNKTLNK